MQSKLPLTGTTIFTVMSALATESGAINLSQGFPDFELDPLLQEYLAEALRNNQVQYAPMPGRLDLRESIAEIVEKYRHITISPTDEITITAGATQALFTAFAMLINAGDEVIIFDPAYDCYDPTVLLFGGKPIHLPLSFPEFSIDWDHFESNLSQRTKLVVLNNPHNPSGAAWNKSDLRRLADILERYPQVYLISDEVYEFIRFGDNHISVLEFETLRKRALVTFSFGKTLHVTGWKLGYVIAPPELTKEFRKVHQFNVFCVNNTMQYAVNRYLQNGPQLDQIAPFYETKRDLFLNAIRNSRFRPLACQGTYFCLLDYRDISLERDTAFAKRLAVEHGVASIPLSVFYKTETDNHVLRFCFAKQDTTLLEAAEKLCRI